MHNQGTRSKLIGSWSKGHPQQDESIGGIDWIDLMYFY